MKKQVIFQVFKDISTFFVASLACLLLLVPFIEEKVNEHEKVEITPLSIEEQQLIVDQVKKHGFRKMIKLKCYEPVVYRIRAGQWADSFCAGAYKHLDFSVFGGDL